jgi:acyl-CoA synthetase (AMP-forming)/AMP-acid ligase II
MAVLIRCEVPVPVIAVVHGVAFGAGSMCQLADHIVRELFIFLPRRRSATASHLRYAMNRVKTFMVISGGVNIYPQECENLLVTHPKVANAAVFGVPNPDLGEEVKGVVQPMPGVKVREELAQELIGFCQQHLFRQKCPRSIDFDPALPRLPTGKLYKHGLRDRYWGEKTSRIV